MAQRLAVAVADKVDQMRAAAVQKVKGALKKGSKVIVIGQYQAGKNVVIRLDTGEECAIPVGKVPATVAWVRKWYPEASHEFKPR